MTPPLPAALALTLVTLGGRLAVAELHGADGVPPPPDHPALRERFHFKGPVLRVHHRGQRRHAPAEAPLPRLLSGRGVEEFFTDGNFERYSQVSAQSTASSPYGFPTSLEDDFDAKEKLGQGSFAVTYLAEEKKTGKEVAVKVLMKGAVGWWLKPSDANEPQFEWLINESKEECIKAQRMHDNDKVDAEGGDHVVRCLEDGITETLADPDRKDDPLFIVLNFVGKNAMDWWTEDVISVKDADPVRISHLLGTVSRHMMMGLRFLTHPGAPQRWVHHDLKPPNMAVMQGKGSDDEPVLNIIDLGTAVSNATSPKHKVICTPLYQPPEWAGPGNSIGYSLPVHSFDTSSAALTMLGMAGNPALPFRTMTVPLPYFYAAAMQVGTVESMQLTTLHNMASCISKLTGHRQDDFEKWMQAYEDCLHSEGLDRYAGLAIEAALNKVRDAESETDRIEALMRLICCNGEDSYAIPANKAATFQIVSEWVNTGFDKVLLAMLELDPSKRPTPQKVLEAQWLQDSYKPESATGTPPELFCEMASQKVQEITFRNITFPLMLIQCAGFFSFLLLFLGVCCHFMKKVPSSAFTALVAALFTLSSASVTTLWMSDTWRMVYLCASFVLGSVLCISGCSAARSSADPNAKKTWNAALFAALGFNLLIFLVCAWVSRPTVNMLNFIEKNHDAFSNARSTRDVGIKPNIRALQIALGSIGLTFFPPWGGVITAVFGIWRDSVHARRAAMESRASVARPDSGTEMTVAAREADPEDNSKNPEDESANP